MTVSSTAIATFDFHGVVVELRSNRPRLVELVSRRLRFFDSSSESPSARFELRAAEEHVLSPPRGPARTVYEPETGEVLYAEETDELYVDYGSVRASCRAADGEVVVSALEPVDEAAWAISRPLFTLPLLEVLKRHAVFGLHAAGVVAGDRAILLAGGSGVGKTTLALALARGGFDFLGDDMVFLSADETRVSVLAFPDELDVSEATVSFFPEIEAGLWPDLLTGAEKRQLPPERLGSALAKAARPSILLFPSISGGEHSAAESISRDEALLELVPNVLLTDPASSQQHLDVLGRLVLESSCYRLSVARDFDEVVGVVRELLER